MMSRLGASDTPPPMGNDALPSRPSELDVHGSHARNEAGSWDGFISGADMEVSPKADHNLSKSLKEMVQSVCWWFNADLAIAEQAEES